MIVNPTQVDTTDGRTMSGEEETSEASGWDIYGIALADDPHSQWRTIREQTPVLDVGEGVFFITRWDLVDEILRDPRHTAGSGVSSSFGAAEGLAFDAMRVWLMSLDGPEQKRARGLVRRQFTPRQIESLRPRIVETTDRLVSQIEKSSEGEPFDLIESVAFALPSEITRSLFGLTEEEWRDEVESVIRSVDDSPGASIQMIEGLAQTFQRRLTRGDIPDGLLAQLQVPDPELGALSPLEVVANAVLLVTAAIDTTAGLIGNVALCLLDRPEMLGRLRQEGGRTASFIEETLRFEPPALSCSRRAGEDLELAGVSIPAGSQLLLGLAAANRDPARYANPDAFDPERDFQGLLSFGGGRHVCLGAALARLEAQVVVERLFIASEYDFESLEKPLWQKRNPTVRALERFPLRAAPRTSSPAPGASPYTSPFASKKTERK
jgi:cytochrome P450